MFVFSIVSTEIPKRHFSIKIALQNLSREKWNVLGGYMPSWLNRWITASELLIVYEKKRKKESKKRKKQIQWTFYASISESYIKPKSVFVESMILWTWLVLCILTSNFTHLRFLIKWLKVLFKASLL